LILLCSTFLAYGAGVELVGVKIRVPDMTEAKSFYSGVLGFQIEKESGDQNKFIQDHSPGIKVRETDHDTRLQRRKYVDAG
jgi:catechol-2,3-dioxygenase